MVDTEDVGSKLFPYIGKFTSDYTVSHPMRHQFSSLLIGYRFSYIPTKTEHLTFMNLYIVIQL